MVSSPQKEQMQRCRDEVHELLADHVMIYRRDEGGYEKLGEIDFEEHGTGGTLRFKRVPYEVVEELAEILGEPFLNERQNVSPTVEEYLDFFEDWNDGEVTFNGYLVSPEREDERVSLEGFTIIGISNTGPIVNRFHGADEFTVKGGTVRAWWD